MSSLLAALRRHRPARPLVALTALVAIGGPLLVGCGGEAGDEQDAATLERFEGEGFAIDLPGEPAVDTQSVPTAAGEIELTIYTVENDDAAVAVAVTDFPDGVPVDLDGAVNGAATNISGEVEASQTGEFNGWETRDARITAERDGQEVTAFVRLIDADGQLVQIQQYVADGDATEPPASYDDIAGSFELT